MKNLAGLNLDLILANVLNCSTLFVSGDDQKSGLATGYARLAAAVREMSPRIPLQRKARLNTGGFSCWS